MGKQVVLTVKNELHEHGPQQLAVVKGPLRLKPGKWAVTTLRLCLGDPVLRGRSDEIGVALSLGEAAVVSAKATITDSARDEEALNQKEKLQSLKAEMALASGEKKPLGCGVVQNCGEAPEILETIRAKVVSKLPEPGVEAIVAAATGPIGGLAAALAMTVIAPMSKKILESLFGKHDLLAAKTEVVGADDGPDTVIVAFAHLTDYSQSNAGEKVTYQTHFGYGPEGHFLCEKVRNSHTPPSGPYKGWKPTDHTYALFELKRVGDA
ncbi:MAG: hypothetical protein H6704_29200 [Myxococcales bacterium]|nr:hypothetical protein [Myxococcales bacterium]